MYKAIVWAMALIFVGLSVAGAATKHRRHAAQAKRVAQPPAQIACTVIGCVPVPPGCGQTAGRSWSGMPTGGDIIVCPPGVAPFK